MQTLIKCADSVPYKLVVHLQMEKWTDKVNQQVDLAYLGAPNFTTCKILAAGWLVSFVEHSTGYRPFSVWAMKGVGHMDHSFTS